MAGEKPYSPTEFIRKAPQVEQAALLPGQNTAYKASGTVDSEVSRLVVVMGKEGFRLGGNAYIVFQYVHMGLGEFGFTPDGQVFRFVFSDLQPKLLTVYGRNLLRIFDYIALRRMPWIRQTDRDFRALGDEADEPVITRIELSDWERKPPRPAKTLAEAVEEVLAKEMA